MRGFESDYMQGALPEVMAELQRTNLVQTPGYGEDEYCERAKALIREKCAAPKADVHFLIGGTQTNFTVIASALRPHQAVVAAASGHIAVHETGAVEATGHKVIALPTADGRLKASQISDYTAAYWADATHEHQAQPAMVYISQPTENGTVYSLSELREISAVCRKNGLLLYADGARLATALAVPGAPSLEDLARLCDVFYIGGTKLGALMGEAVVIVNDALKLDFRCIMKQKGAMLAKGRLLGVQFCVLMSDGLYEAVGRREVELALRLKKAFEDKGLPLLYDSPTNQQFPILSDAQADRLLQKWGFEDWERTDAGHRAVRFCTGWGTRAEDVDELIADIRDLDV